MVLASGGGRTLENLQHRILAGHLDARIELVIVSGADLGATRKAQDLDLPLLVISKDSFPERSEREHRLVGAILEARPDLVILAGWLQLLPIPAELEGKVLNIHPALLPAFGGKGFYGNFVHEAVAASSARVSGCTVHFASDQYDVGPIVLQNAVAIPTDADAEAIAALVFQKECEAYPEAIQMLLEQRALWREGRVIWN
ncbi:MAG: formyltransferase family protein [Planctomycetota bacterium]